MHLRLACRMNVKNETARILPAHAERAVSANAFVTSHCFKCKYIKKERSQLIWDRSFLVDKKV